MSGISESAAPFGGVNTTEIVLSSLALATSTNA